MFDAHFERVFNQVLYNSHFDKTSSIYEVAFQSILCIFALICKENKSFQICLSLSFFTMYEILAKHTFTFWGKSEVECCALQSSV